MYTNICCMKDQVCVYVCVRVCACVRVCVCVRACVYIYLYYDTIMMPPGYTNSYTYEVRYEGLLQLLVN